MSLDSVTYDFRFAVRALLRSPRFALVVLATLTVGIGANVAAFSLVDAVLLRPLPLGSRSDRARVVPFRQNDVLRP